MASCLLDSSHSVFIRTELAKKETALCLRIGLGPLEQQACWTAPPSFSMRLGGASLQPCRLPLSDGFLESSFSGGFPVCRPFSTECPWPHRHFLLLCVHVSDFLSGNQVFSARSYAFVGLFLSGTVRGSGAPLVQRVFQACMCDCPQNCGWCGLKNGFALEYPYVSVRSTSAHSQGKKYFRISV